MRDDINPWRDENGIMFIGVEQFLLDESAYGETDLGKEQHGDYSDQ